MQLNQLSKTKKQKIARRVGRGGKRGTYSGRGVKGQKARAGRKMRPEWRDVLKRIPKRRGYKFKSLKEKPVVFNLGQLNNIFNEGDLVNTGVLLNKGLINKIKGKVPQVKILGEGELLKRLDFKGILMSASAKEKIEKAGGKIL